MFTMLGNQASPWLLLNCTLLGTIVLLASLNAKEIYFFHIESYHWIDCR